MESTANRNPKPLAVLAQAAAIGLGVFMLAACGGADIAGGYAQPSYPPTSNPPTSNTPEVWTPFVDLDVISPWTDGDGQMWVNAVHGRSRLLDNAQVTVDGRAADASALRNRDVALIRGTRMVYSGDGPGGEISERIGSIDVYHLVVGVIDSVDALHARLVVMGQQVSVTGDTDVHGNRVSEGALAAAQPGEMVAVSGFLTASGEVIATRIARTDSQDEFLLRGLVSATDAAAGRFRIGGLDVDYARAAIDRQDFTNGDPALGDQVVVRADTGPTGGVLVAHSVTFVPRSLSVDADTYVVLNGMVTRYASGDDFDIAGLTARLDCFGVDCESITQDLASDAAVQLTGAVDTDGLVRAWHLSTFPGGLQSPWADGETTVVAPIAAIDAGTGALTVSGFQLQPLAHTRFIDHRSGGESSMSAEDLQVGDVVSAAGSYGGTPGLLIAESIARLPQQDPQVVTHRFGRAEPAIIVLGRPILTSGATRWDQCGIATGAAELFGDEIYIYYLTIGLPTLAVDPLEAAWVSMYNDSC